MGKGAGRSVASAPAVLALLAREAAGAPALAWVSWDDLDAPPAAARATLYPDPGPSAVSEPAAAAPRADGAFLDGLGAAPRSCFEAGSEPAPPPRVAAAHGGESDAARAPETGRAEGGPVHRAAASTAGRRLCGCIASAMQHRVTTGALLRAKPLHCCMRPCWRAAGHCS